MQKNWDIWKANILNQMKKKGDHNMKDMKHYSSNQVKELLYSIFDNYMYEVDEISETPNDEQKTIIQNINMDRNLLISMIDSIRNEHDSIYSSLEDRKQCEPIEIILGKDCLDDKTIECMGDNYMMPFIPNDIKEDINVSTVTNLGLYFTSGLYFYSRITWLLIANIRINAHTKANNLHTIMEYMANLDKNNIIIYRNVIIKLYQMMRDVTERLSREDNELINYINKKEDELIKNKTPNLQNEVILLCNLAEKYERLLDFAHFFEKIAYITSSTLNRMKPHSRLNSVVSLSRISIKKPRSYISNEVIKIYCNYDLRDPVLHRLQEYYELNNIPDELSLHLDSPSHITDNLFESNNIVDSKVLTGLVREIFNFNNKAYYYYIDNLDNIDFEQLPRFLSMVVLLSDMQRKNDDIEFLEHKGLFFVPVASDNQPEMIISQSIKFVAGIEMDNCEFGQIGNISICDKNMKIINSATYFIKKPIKDDKFSDEIELKIL